MGNFTHIIIFGNNAEGADIVAWNKTSEEIKKYKMETVYWGGALGCLREPCLDN